MARRKGSKDRRKRKGRTTRKPNTNQQSTLVRAQLGSINQVVNEVKNWAGLTGLRFSMNRNTANFATSRQPKKPTIGQRLKGIGKHMKGVAGSAAGGAATGGGLGWAAGMALTKDPNKIGLQRLGAGGGLAAGALAGGVAKYRQNMKARRK